MDAAYELLTGRGVDLGEIVTLGAEGRPGFRHVFFSDPDGNAWTIQEFRALGLPLGKRGLEVADVERVDRQRLEVVRAAAGRRSTIAR